MILKPHASIAPLILALGLSLGVTAADASNRFNGSVAQERLIQRGMSMSQVEGAIGRPDHIAQYVNEIGPSWTYRAGGTSWRETGAFEIDFGADGRVVSWEQVMTDESR